HRPGARPRHITPLRARRRAPVAEADVLQPRPRRARPGAAADTGRGAAPARRRLVRRAGASLGEGGVTGALPVAILAAMPEEIRGLGARARVTRRLRIGRCGISVGRLEDVPVLIACTGDGAANAGAGAGALFDAFPVSRAVVVGVSGALSPALEPGRLLVATDVIE